MVRDKAVTQFRPCTEADVDAVLMLQRQWANESITYGVVPSHRGALLAQLGPYFLVAVRGGRVVAYAYGVVRQDEGSAVIPANEAYLEIEEVYVEADLRKRGIGTEILDRLMATARANGIDRFQLSSATKDMDTILKFYRRLGFRTWYIRMFQ